MPVENDERTDDALLQQYVLSGDQQAFAALVARYGPMVWGVCRRIVRHTHDAEDALQATFAVLARKARSIQHQRTIGGWLYQVARRIALRAKSTSNRRNILMPVSAITATAQQDVTVPKDADNVASSPAEILDDEIARLPTTLRLPIILCYLEGLTNREAAQRLGCPEGTIVSRLARAREKLRQFLTRRGVVLGGAAAMTALLSELATAAPLTPELKQAAEACARLPAIGPLSSASAAAGSILSAGASRLATDALRSMTVQRFAHYAGYFASGLAAMSAVVFLTVRLVDFVGRPVFSNNAVANVAMNGTPEEGFSLQGIWEGADLEFLGGAAPDEHEALSRNCRWVVVGQTIRFKWQDEAIGSADFEVNGSAAPFNVDIRPKDFPQEFGGEVLRGAFRRKQQFLELVTGVEGQRPESIQTGIVARPDGDSLAVRAGVLGYARFKRIFRSFEAEELQGKWVLERWEASGIPLAMDDKGRDGARFDNGSYTLYKALADNIGEIPGRFSLDPAQPTRFMEMNPQDGQAMSCLYQIEGDTLRLVAAAPGSERPESFKTEPDQKQVLWVFRRAKSSNAQPGPR